MGSGSFILVFSLLMLSLTHPGQWWAVFLLNGVGIGLAVGLMYIPGMGILSHYFLKRRTVAQGIAVTVCLPDSRNMNTDLKSPLTGLSHWWPAPPYHAEQMVPWTTRFPQRRAG